MATPGETLRAARERMGATASQAAAATRIMVQHIEAMESNQFQRIPAPTYAKGFIRMYAEYLGLNPGPLVKEYTDRYMPRVRPSIQPSNEPAPAPGAAPRAAPRSRPAPAADEPDAAPRAPPVDFGKAWRAFGAAIGQAWQSFRPALQRVPWKILAGVTATVAILFFVIRIAVTSPATPDRGVVVEKEARVKVPSDVPSVVREPPEPYLEVRGAGGRSP